MAFSLKKLTLSAALCLIPAISSAACNIPEQQSGFQSAVIDAVNQERAAKGLGPVQLSSTMYKTAQAHACDIAAHQKVSHQGSDGSRLGTRLSRNGYRLRTAVENAAAGQTSANGVMQGWMGSPGHRKNIMANGVVEAGLGVAYGPSDDRLYWILVMAAPRN
ncbi:MAG: CAP domain-containing protein [Microgenomates group bacterium]